MAKFLVTTAEQDSACEHPRCGKVIRKGEDVFPARLRDSAYCSPKCRNKHTRLLIQTKRRQTKAQQEYERNNKLINKYGITSNDWDRLYDEQLGRCAICLIPLAETKPHVDHDHITGVVRGLLCKFCNPGLGYFQDSIDNLERAVSYLKAQRQRVSAEVGEEVTGQCH